MTDRETQLEGFALDKFSIVEFIAAGGFAEVYRAHDQRLDVDVVVKVLKPRLADPPTVRRFRDEALSIAKLQRPTAHPNIIDVLDVGDSHGYHWLAMRLLHGETLADRMQRGALALSEAIRVIGGVAAALDHAHSRSLIHRDVKPSNIFLTDDGGVVLMDFGLVREQHNPAGTATTSIIGTPQYMSPEQIKGEGLSHRSDIYSLGHVCYELIAGQPAFPYASGNTWQVLEHQVKDDPPPLVQPDGTPVADAVQAVVGKALAKAPGDRWPKAGAMADALRLAAIEPHPFVTGVLPTEPSSGAEPSASAPHPTSTGEVGPVRRQRAQAALKVRSTTADALPPSSVPDQVPYTTEEVETGLVIIAFVIVFVFLCGLAVVLL